MGNEYSRAELLDSVIGRIENNTTNNITLSAALPVESLLSETVQNAVKDYKTVTEYFDSDFIGNNDKKLKKVVSAAIIVAKHTGVAPLPLQGLDATQIASTVDTGLTQIKAAYQTAKGTFATQMEAIDVLVDRGAARLCTMIDQVTPKLQDAAEQAVETFLPKAINAATYACQRVFPVTAPVMEVIRGTSPYITKALKPVVREGVKLVSNTAKTVVHSLANTVKSFGKKVVNWLKS